MASTIWEFFGYRAADNSTEANNAVRKKLCPFINGRCEKTFSDGVVSGVCALKQIKSGPVICCPIRLYGNNYRVLSEVAAHAFGPGLSLVPGSEAQIHAEKHSQPCIAVFGKRWGRELRLPQKEGRGSYFVDWVLAKLDAGGNLEEFVAVEVQTIDTTGNYRNGFAALLKNRSVVKTTAGLNWENVSKRILPQLIYKGQVLQREDLCKKGLYFICPEPVFLRIAARLGGNESLIRYPLQPASLTFLTYSIGFNNIVNSGCLEELTAVRSHTTTIYKVQEAFNNVTLPQENVYKAAIIKALSLK